MNVSNVPNTASQRYRVYNYMHHINDHSKSFCPVSITRYENTNTLWSGMEQGFVGARYTCATKMIGIEEKPTDPCNPSWLNYVIKSSKYCGSLGF